MFTRLSSSATHRSLRSLWSALAQVVLFISNLSLNLKPATTYRDTNRQEVKNIFSPRSSLLMSSSLYPPVWWRSRHCADWTGEWSRTWSYTWRWRRKREPWGHLSSHQCPPGNPNRKLSLEQCNHLQRRKVVEKDVFKSCLKLIKTFIEFAFLLFFKGSTCNFFICINCFVLQI